MLASVLVLLKCDITLLYKHFFSSWTRKTSAETHWIFIMLIFLILPLHTSTHLVDDALHIYRYCCWWCWWWRRRQQWCGRDVAVQRILATSTAEPDIKYFRQNTTEIRCLSDMFIWCVFHLPFSVCINFCTTELLIITLIWNIFPNGIISYQMACVQWKKDTPPTHYNNKHTETFSTNNEVFAQRYDWQKWISFN